MSKSFGMVMLVLCLLPVWVSILADFFKYLKYRLTVMEEQISSDAQNNEPPMLVLEFLIPLKLWVIMMIIFPVIFIVFFIADNAARDDMNKLFFSLNKEQTYILYYWAWMFVFGSMLLLFGVWVTYLFNKKISFFKNIVILENSLTGRKSLVLDDNVRCTKSKHGDAYWLYNELSMKHFQIMNRDLMKKLNSRQEKLLDEFLSRIPEKKKTFYI